MSRGSKAEQLGLYPLLDNHDDGSLLISSTVILSGGKTSDIQTSLVIHTYDDIKSTEP